MTAGELAQELKNIDPNTELYFVSGQDKVKRLDVYFEEKTVWVNQDTQKDVAVMYGDY